MRIFICMMLTLLTSSSVAFSATIKGNTLFTGELPPLAPYKTGKYRKACGSEVQNESLIVDSNRVKNVVVSLYGNNLGKNKDQFRLDQKNCRYEPHIISMPVDSELNISSSDPVNHNIHTYSFDNDPINIMFIPNQEEYSQEMEEAEVIKVECDLHNWMTAWIVVTPNSYSSISDKNGVFEINNVPPGNYKLNAWHETLGDLSKNIVVKDEDIKINFNFLELIQE